jgi:hypothetical protein
MQGLHALYILLAYLALACYSSGQTISKEHIIHFLKFLKLHPSTEMAHSAFSNIRYTLHYMYIHHRMPMNGVLLLQKVWSLFNLARKSMMSSRAST